jgi:putative ABC transport system ATP-binding protein
LRQPLLAAQSIEVAFGRTPALRGVTISLDPGEIVAVTGPSGSGKSTLLLCLAGVLRPSVGAVSYSYEGRCLDALSERDRSQLRRREFGLVMQFGGLVPELTALQNVAVPLLLDGLRPGIALLQAWRWLERLEVADVAGHVPGELSGGQLQRVATARALVASPRVIFADEPTGALDTVQGERLLEELVRTAHGTGAALMLVTHDNRVAATADREVVLRDGRVDGTSV